MSRYGQSVLDFLLRRDYQLNAAATVQPPSVQLGNNLIHRFRYRLKIPLSTAVNGVDTLRDHVAMPVGAFRTGRSLRVLDRYDLERIFHC